MPELTLAEHRRSQQAFRESIPGGVPGAEDVLAAVVETMSGGSGEARPGQVKLVRAVEATMKQVSHHPLDPAQTAYAAATGTGKSLAYLVPAMLRAATRNERTVVSTESLGLQRQLVDEDVPLVQGTLMRLGLRRVEARVLKGAGNYIDPRKTVLTAAAYIAALNDSLNTSERKRKVTGDDGESTTLGLALAARKKAADKALDPIKSARIVKETKERVQLSVEELEAAVLDVLQEVEKAHALVPARTGATVTLDGDTFGRQALYEAIVWAVQTGIVGAESGHTMVDRDDYDGTVEPGLWDHFTCLADGIPTDSPVKEASPATRAKALAAASDVVITNHTFLAIQAAKDLPAVLSNRNVGPVDHLVIDEAHRLPEITRNQAESSVGAGTLKSLARAFERRIGDDAPAGALSVPVLVNRASVLATTIEDALGNLARHPKQSEDFPVEEEADPTSAFSTGVLEWLSDARSVVNTAVRKLANAAGSESESKADSLRALGRRINDTASTVRGLTEHRTGWARWIHAEESRFGAGGIDYTLKTTAVNVAGILRNRVYTAYLPPEYDPEAALDEEMGKAAEGSDVPRWRTGEPYPLSVTCLSATLGQTFPVDAGINASISSVETPFETAYAESAAFAPSAGREFELAATDVAYPGTKRLDHAKHAAWAREATSRLVSANGGRALVLITSSSNGRDMAAHLRQSLPPGIKVLDQWSGSGSSVLLREFAADETSVMVATRGWMTGKNIPGEACSLVVLDRVPRAPGNAVDDARAEMLAGGNKPTWNQKDRIYGSDAATLLEQAFGRLIRKASDRGMVAVLDPRIAKHSKLASKDSVSRKLYAEVIRPYGKKYDNLSAAVSWLRDRRAALDNGPSA